MPDSAAPDDCLDILVVDDDPLVSQTLANILEEQDHELTMAGTAEQALAAINETVFDMAFVDLVLGDVSGVELLPRLLERCPWLKVVVITAHASVETAVKAMRRGAVDYLTKPFSPSQVRIIVGKVGATRRLERQVQALREDVNRLVPAPDLDSEDPAMKRVVDMARQVAPSDATILINGESGTGKGVLARAIHAWSDRSEGLFSVVSCPSLSPDLLESELFGHVRGAFTGAVASNPGRIAVSEGGTLFLDEIGEMPERIQPKLLRFLQDREYERVGDAKTRTANVRVIAATNADLEGAVAAGTFREDLYYRLNVIQLTMPPLRDRKDDIARLAEGFLRFFTAKYNKPILGFTDEASAFVRSHRWVGNVRELQNAVERAVILCTGDTVGRELFQGADGGGRIVSTGMAPSDGLLTLEAMEEKYIRHVLEVTDSIEHAAEALGVAPSTLWRRRRKYGI